MTNRRIKTADELQKEWTALAKFWTNAPTKRPTTTASYYRNLASGERDGLKFNRIMHQCAKEREAEKKQ